MIRKAPSTASSLIGPGSLGLGLALGLALGLPACDDSGEQRKDGAPGTPDGKSPDAKAPDAKGPTPSITKFKSPAEAIGAYNKCYSDCFTANTNATNRETCKLDCDSLAETGMFYVPQFYDISYGTDGAITKISPNRPGVPYRVQRWILTDLDEWPYPKAPLVPLAETVHERYSVEIFRGCTRGCTSS